MKTSNNVIFNPFKTATPPPAFFLNQFRFLVRDDTIHKYDEGVPTKSTANTMAIGINISTAIGYNAEVCASNTMVLGYSSIPSKRQTVVIGDCAPVASPSVYSFQVNGEAWALNWFNASDKRLKSNIKPINNAIDKLTRLNGYTYDYLKENEFNIKPKIKSSAGVIAQEVREVLPLAVQVSEENGLHSVNYDAIVALLIQGINELNDKVDELKRIIEVQKAIDSENTTELAFDFDNARIDFEISPNPAKSEISLILEEYDPTTRYFIQDLSGSSLISGKLAARESTVDISKLSQGSYVLILSNNAGMIGSKIFVKI